MPVNQAACGAQKRESGLGAVTLRPCPCGPWALIPVNGKKNEIEGEIRTEKMAAARDLGSPGGDPIESKLSFSRLYRPLSNYFT
jgi:hypothetical protein